MESASGGDDRKDSLFDIAPRSALSSRQSSEEDAFFDSILALGDGDHDFLRDGDHDLPGCTLQHLQDTWIGSDLEPAFGMNDTWQGATGEQTHVDDEGTRDGDSKPDPGDPAHFDETDREEAARLIATRTQLLTVLPAPALPLVVQFLFSSNRVAGMNAAQAERMTALALGVDEQELRQWRATSSTTVTLASGPPSMFSGTAVGAELVSGTQTSSIAESNTTTGSTTYVPSLQRTWLLHDYPELHAKAQEYVDEGFRGQSDRPRPFKITEFQKWVNEELLQPFYDINPRFRPISHSTARAWLSRLGYYERLSTTFTGGASMPTPAPPSASFPATPACGDMNSSRIRSDSSGASSSGCGETRARRRSNTWF